MEQQNTQLFDLHVDHEGTQYLAQAAKWGRFLSIIGFVFVALIAIFSLFAGSILAKYMSGMGNMDRAGSSALAGLGGTITFIYLLVAVLWFIPILYIYRFSTKMQLALRSNDQQVLNDSFKNLKSCFRFLGIMTIIVMAVYLLAIVVALGAFVFAGR